MIIKTNITRLDIVRVNVLLLPKVKSNWVFLVSAFTIWFALGVFQLKDELSLQEVVGYSLLISIAVTVGFFAVVFTLLLAVNAINASERTGLGEHEYEVTEEGLRESTRLNEEFSIWENFRKVWQFRRYVLVVRHWSAIHIFPRRSFNSAQDFDEFYKILKKRI